MLYYWMTAHLLLSAQHADWILSTHHLFILQAAKEEQKKIPPSQLFLSETDKYSKFDDKVFFLLTASVRFGQLYVHLLDRKITISFICFVCY